MTDSTVAVNVSVLFAAPGSGVTNRPTVRIQYTGRSFAEMLAERLLPRFLRPRTNRHAPRGLFPSQSEFGSECPDPFTKKVYDPLFLCLDRLNKF